MILSDKFYTDIPEGKNDVLILIYLQLVPFRNFSIMQDIISFYKSVFKEELSNAKKLHFDSSRIKKRYLLSGDEELINGHYPLIPVPEKKIKAFEVELTMNAGQMELKYYSSVRLSKFTAFGNDVRHMYPLIEYDAEIIYKDELYYIKIDLASRKVIKTNFSLGVQTQVNFESIFNNNEETDFHQIYKLAEQIEKVDGSDVEELMLFPKLNTSRQLSAKLKAHNSEQDRYLAAAALCLVEVENYNFSTLDELEQMEKVEDYSMPLKVLFNSAKIRPKQKKGVICEELNYAQLVAIENAGNAVVSSISGPPGTGKSYTIANVAVEFASKGLSVLISSKNNEALEVIEEKIHAQLNIDNLTVNPSKDKQLKGLKSYLKTILGRGYKRSGYSAKDVDDLIKDYHEKKQALVEKEKSVENSFELEKEILKLLDTNPRSAKTSTVFKKRILVERGKKTIPLWTNLYEYYNAIDSKRQQAIKAIKANRKFELDNAVYSKRGFLRTYFDFLKARNAVRKADLYSDLEHDTIVKTFPIWLVKAADISKVIPFKKEVFDLVIIDEASQCDTPSMIPLLQRAKQCIVVGDQNQLGHISFVSKIKENVFRANVRQEVSHLCHHRDYSFLNLVNDTISMEQQAFLLEHFRSEFGIIDFSSKTFYEGELAILTKRPTSTNNVVEFVKVKGKKTNKGNEEEVKTIIDDISSIIQTEKDRPADLKTSIGILSPFRKQVDLLFETVKKTFDLTEIKAHQIRVGTAFSFQGNERDIMFISLVADDETHAGTLNFMNRKDVFNVSVTRARFRQIIVHSFTPNNLKFESTLQKYFAYYQHQLNHNETKGEEDQYCKEISKYFEGVGYKTWLQYEISGVSIDVLAEKDGSYIAIDLVGFPGSVGDFYPLERYKMLERGNIRLFPLPYAYWLYDKQICLNAIEALCQN